WGTDLILVGQVLAVPRSGAGSNPGGGSPPPGSGIHLSPSDLDLLARLVTAEAEGESYEGQVAVAATVLNRLRDPRYPDTVSGVIFQYVNGLPQFSPVANGRIYLPATETARQAVLDALKGWDPTNGALGFYNPAKTSNQWVRQQPVTSAIGNHLCVRIPSGFSPGSRGWAGALSARPGAPARPGRRPGPARPGRQAGTGLAPGP